MVFREIGMNQTGLTTLVRTQLCEIAKIPEFNVA